MMDAPNPPEEPRRWVELVDPDAIENLVGRPRHAYNHWGRLDSATQVFYILHSGECFSYTHDLRTCPYSLALERTIELSKKGVTLFAESDQDCPVELGISVYGALVPVH